MEREREVPILQPRFSCFYVFALQLRQSPLIEAPAERTLEVGVFDDNQRGVFVARESGADLLQLRPFLRSAAVRQLCVYDLLKGFERLRAYKQHEAAFVVAYKEARCPADACNGALAYVVCDTRAVGALVHASLDCLQIQPPDVAEPRARVNCTVSLYHGAATAPAFKRSDDRTKHKG